MSAAEEYNPDLYFIRHGQYDMYGSGYGLTAVGREQSMEAALTLEESGFGDSDLVLSSTETRAAQTGEIIADLFGAHHESDEWLKACGMDPDLVHMAGSPHELVGRILTTRSIGKSAMRIAVVTHQPLVNTVIGRPNAYHGQVAKYDAAKWGQTRTSVLVERFYQNQDQ